MELGLALPYEANLSFAEMVELTNRAEDLGFDSVWMPEAYGTDAISILGALAARTSRIRLATGIINVFSRTPALIAQTAATMDMISGGRFILGLGTSGHQVITGWHGVPFEKPVQRMRETVQIVHSALRREPVRFDGEVFRLTHGLKLLMHPIRAEIPIFLATLTPAGLRLTGEIADGWIPFLFSPERKDLFLDDLKAGAAAAGRRVDSLQVAPFMRVVVDEDRQRARDEVRPFVALYVGGMGSRLKNFYKDTISRYGFADAAATIQDLYLTGRKLEAIKRVPDTMVDTIALVGPAGLIKERLAACASAGVTTLIAAIQGRDQGQRLRTIEILAAGRAG
ncbi:MAG: LLM class F420-dependent oxidoreductase [Candidatus Dormibacteraeota bacterium]|nr:LLM class F420-dependent oxidoreductase [Candidatus Dormibacteraeota bacterium]